MPVEIAGGTEAAQKAWRMENWGCSGNAYLEDVRITHTLLLESDTPICHLIS